ncbi:hypothetical protein ALI144C_00125 [Actinosynnema sp. ALI-1.44]|nr:hypothetical protein ALI144C_00125 [Actinosynnema sp. ALI-1.44]
MDNTGLFDAAVATGSFAIPSKLPGPSFGTAPHAEPNCAVIAEEVGGACDGWLPVDAPVSLDPHAAMDIRAKPPMTAAAARGKRMMVFSLGSESSDGHSRRRSMRIGGVGNFSSVT